MTPVDNPAVDPLADPSRGLRLRVPARVVSAGSGARWVAEGWRLFAAAPFLWIAAIIGLFILMVAMNLVPVVGGAVFQVLQVVFWAGFIVGCRSIERTGEFEPADLFAGFRVNFIPLVCVALIYFACGLAIALMWVAFVGLQSLYVVAGGMLAAAQSGDYPMVIDLMIQLAQALVIPTLLALALLVPLFAAIWFAPALVVMHGLGPVAAMKESLVAGLKNSLPFIVYGLVMLVLTIAIPLTFGLALLVYMPLVVTTAYASYRDILTEEPGPAGSTTPRAFADAPAAPPPPPI